MRRGPVRRGASTGSFAGAILVAASVASTAMAGCSAPARAPRAAPAYPDQPFTRPLVFGAITIEPPAAGDQPLVPVSRARSIAQRPLAWPPGGRSNSLVAFGYGRVSAPTDTVDEQPIFDRRLAWVAVYRSSAAHLLFGDCLDGPGGRRGYHYVPADPKPDPFYVAVLVDAVTGVQATSTPVFHDTCPRLIRDTRSRRLSQRAAMTRGRPAPGRSRCQASAARPRTPSCRRPPIRARA